MHQFNKHLRLTIYISTILFAALLLGFRFLTNPVTIIGHLKNNSKDNSAFVDRVIVFVKADNKILAKVLTDEKGDFEITIIPQKEKSFDFYCTGLGLDTLLISSVTTFESDTNEMAFYIPGLLKRNALGKVICPICKRADKVYKIQYGDAPVITRHISNTGDTTYSPKYKGTYQESCIIGPAKYYCDRDKAKF
ncbi:hypothetical protein [Limnovirga soli]|uniref:Uncharacterized protein n=1 Tax=Limnovirga soli TaxID=2656915 RepID=A0A8J8FIW9_9BACT|nr:hypothetical protein [Limnovirga soli]NNV58028.1 hypothetical protein [Limnovirga soli]